MTEVAPQKKQEYLDTLLRYYEEEIGGEAYFYGLAEYFEERDKTILLARIERRAALAIRPLLDKYGLVPREEAVIHKEGRDYIKYHQSFSWVEFMSYIVDRYPGYLDDFKGLEAMAPDEDLEALKMLTKHEVVVIDFAKMELAGNPDSLQPLTRYLN